MSSDVLIVQRTEAISRALGEMLPISFWRDPARDAADIVEEKARDYPPDRPGSSYIRTFKLQRSWNSRVVVSGNELARTESRGVEYNIWVKDRTMQATVHHGWWNTTFKDVQQVESGVIDVYDRYAQEHWNRVP